MNGRVQNHIQGSSVTFEAVAGEGGLAHIISFRSGKTGL